MSRSARGYRNNNPGNLIKTSIAWQGKKPHAQNTDSRFEQFIELRWGVRAMLMDIIRDIRKGTNTLKKLLNEYAPKFENNTNAYIGSVSRETGINPDVVLKTDRDTLQKLAIAISRVENGSPLTVEEFIAGYNLLPANLKTGTPTSQPSAPAQKKS